MFNKIVDVKPLDDFILEIEFENSITKKYDVKKQFDKQICFETLKDVNGLFKQVKVDIGGFGISWNDDLDISSNELWVKGI